MGPDIRDPALDAASVHYRGLQRSGESIFRQHRGKIGLAIGLALGLLYSPKVNIRIDVSDKPPVAQRAPAPPDPEIHRRILLACGFDENDERICIPLSPEMLDEFNEF